MKRLAFRITPRKQRRRFAERENCEKRKDLG
jgi:hypothetical protein